ncbi:protein YIPF1 homolog isoform X3 [Brassica napus]|uniref:protein YIPF1 homolog isoform X1 n=1 Tax=Brassica oleracea var. oleracea TaxID=109376 RepID=UPI0006A7519C|nr:PREDICTED: protein YIPF1 homolog isoform X1 [Brassica oleracea var. oleracea]XP_022557225.1 protein YIPF1 homolog isoform X3 [Brassica napus]
MDESFANLETSHLIGSVPAVISDDNKSTNVHTASVNEGPSANIQIFPPHQGNNNAKGYQTLDTPTERPEQQPSNSWKGFFNVYSYTQYFDVDTDVVVNRLMSSLYPTSGDFFNKIDANPDMYGLVWICTTLVFVLSSLGNCATYLVKKRTDGEAPWVFDVNYINLAASIIYGYAIIVPLAFYFSLRYMGSRADLLRFWCLWGYSLFIFIPTSLPLLIPVEFLRWVIILSAGSASSCFVALNLRSYLEGSNDLTVVVAAAVGLQMVLSIFIKRTSLLENEIHKVREEGTIQ